MSADYLLGLSSIHGRLAVGLVNDGRVLFAVEEDKLRRFRGLGLGHLADAGSRALGLALHEVPGGARGVGSIVYVSPIGASDEQIGFDKSSIRQFFEAHYGPCPTIRVVDHVAAHCAFERTVHSGVTNVFMLGRSRAVFSGGRGCQPELDVACDLVSWVERAGVFAGFSPLQIHHLENMARFGEARFADSFRSLRDDGLEERGWDAAFSRVTGLRRRFAGQTLDEGYYHFAASVYRVLRAEAIGLLETVPLASRKGPIAVCGGVFQSWTLNDALAEAFPENRILASFAPGNPSGAIGGPLVASTGELRSVGPFLGPRYTREEIKSVLDNSKVRYALLAPAETVARVCRALEAGQMVGWFEGRCEFGYRALGSRSVFANPANPYSCDNLSSYLKKRPSYFAYAVAIDQDDPLVAGIDSPYLSRSVLLPEYFGDSRVRVQSVSKSLSPRLWNLLEEFQKESGVPALLNTSLNYFDEPIACAPRDALKTFFASGLDVLVMEDFLLMKDEL